MIKPPSIGLLCVLGFLSVWVNAQESDAASEMDPSCEHYYASSKKIAEIKDSRITSTRFNGLEGKTIRNIEYDNKSVFDKDDPKENNGLYMFLNKLHVNTRPIVVRTQLLFAEGDQFNQQKVEESERILRKRPYLANAYILPKSICADQVDLVVITQDSWALEPQVSMSKKSEGTESGFAISDGNIMGTGTEFTIGYEQNNDRNLISYDISNPHIFNSQISTRVFYADTSDGRDTIVDIEHPFYSLETPWATGFYTQDVTQELRIRHGDEEINRFRYQSMFNEVYFGVATDVQDSHTQRWLIGMSNEEDKFFEMDETLLPVPQRRKAAYPWIEYQYLENRFGVFKNVNQIQRAEDIALGQNLRLRFGYAGTRFDNPDDVARFIGEYTNIIGMSEQHILEAGVTVDGRHHSKLEGADSTVLGLDLAYNYFADEKNRWYLGFQYNVGQDLAQYEELTVGDITGLRGYPSDYQRGDERYVFTVERRYFSDIHIFNILRVGAVAFFDIGKAWGLEQYGASPTLSNVGFGLRLSSTKVRIGNVVHVDIATPLTARDGLSEYQLTIGAQKKF
jgi:hypothetical protein